MDETWRTALGFEGLYEVSSIGRVRRSADGPGTFPGRIRRLQKNEHGYMAVTLYAADGQKRCLVHVLVAEAFIRPRPSGLEVNHINTRKDDNRVDNLEWVTKQRNVDHAIANGLVGGRPMPGETNGRAVLSAADAERLRVLKGTMTQGAAAKMFGICRSQVGNIWRGERWNCSAPMAG